MGTTEKGEGQGSRFQANAPEPGRTDEDRGSAACPVGQGERAAGTEQGSLVPQVCAVRVQFAAAPVISTTNRQKKPDGMRDVARPAHRSPSAEPKTEETVKTCAVLTPTLLKA
jgi:hypothetical protein